MGNIKEFPFMQIFAQYPILMTIRLDTEGFYSMVPSLANIQERRIALHICYCGVDEPHCGENPFVKLDASHEFSQKPKVSDFGFNYNHGTMDYPRRAQKASVQKPL
jgi:hypothetical protein